jgi:putative endonuclease
MNKNKDLGQEGEQIAIEYLRDRGYNILKRNYRYGRKEIDIIASEGIFLVFVEVKMRRNSRYGMPEEAVDNRKAERIRVVAEQYLSYHEWPGPIRFDIIAILKKHTFEIEHFKDAF